MMRAIPKKLLIHDAVLKREKKNEWGSGALETVTELSRIRIEPSSRITRDKNNVEYQLAATLFFDCKNSQPFNQKFREDDIVDFHGSLHRIISIELLYDEKKLHHYEMGMIRYAGKDEDQLSNQTDSQGDPGGW